MSENETGQTRGDERIDLIVADTNNDGKADLWVVDTDGDGKADLFQFDHDGDGKVDLTIIDRTQDGNPDEVIKGDAGIPPLTVEPPARVAAKALSVPTEGLHGRGRWPAIARATPRRSSAEPTATDAAGRGGRRSGRCGGSARLSASS